MKIEFDADKDLSNLAKHGLSLSFGQRVLEAEDQVTLPSHRAIDGEDRSKAVGLVDGKLYTAVHVWRSDTVRMISVRRSNETERRDYDRYSSGPERPGRF
jgi:uncharacterized protein